MKEVFSLYIQKDLTDKQFEKAVNICEWFIKESFSQKKKWNSKKQEWEIDKTIKVPCWKHLTRGGHRNGLPIQRGCYGHLYKNYDLVFRRVSNKKRHFAIVHKDTLLPLEEFPNTSCICKDCFGGVKTRWKNEKPEMMEYFSYYKE